ncbi:alpha-protein kinase 3-like [Syngnathoides biaculeatus]|uniref:alpha-protein kinase 3-like n=1 Tax=Syngnathoides biaculeatus TaxID=300417 RepID=UPI002ADD51CC|nr:alpha-protein kinase 3-like [Syngnathoides biaculeatus]
MSRSHSANGRFGQGNSRPGGCSYISNVRPENRYTLCTLLYGKKCHRVDLYCHSQNRVLAGVFSSYILIKHVNWGCRGWLSIVGRLSGTVVNVFQILQSISLYRSTLCSMIAQLTQETQPAFVSTLKSSAVSENCNVKFVCVVTGYPIPLITWYKDDKQLDRFCGLPKYEIFRNGQNHSLHIYNCTLEDAAIYQASASNSKGIVSCSAVLEVGGMNEFKIHQRYFSKLKQKPEDHGKDADGKENQVPFRVVSPERSQRKRRSTVEAFLRVPSSTEDEATEELIPFVGEDSKVRLEEPAEDLVEERPAPLTKTSAKNNNESGVGGGIAKTPFVKKKIKICSRGERTPEETREVSSEEFMEVVRHRNMAERQNREACGKLLRTKSSEALRSPEGVRKDKENNREGDEKVFEKNPRVSARLRSAPATQRASSRVIQQMADSGSADGIRRSRAALPEKTSDQSPQQETQVRQRNPFAQSEKGDFDSPLSSATPQELASGARRKILSSKDKPEESKLLPYPHPQKEEVSSPDNTLSTSPVSIISSPKCSRRSPVLLQPNDERNSHVEKRSPILGRKKITAVTKASGQLPDENKQSEKSEKDRLDPCKAPQVIRKLRCESFVDGLGHLKLWCQFFNILSDSTIVWYRNELEIAQIKRSAGDESQVNLAMIQASSKDSGVYKCTITNDYGSDSTDFLLGPEILAGISLREDHAAGEEIEMAPMVFSKGVAESGIWGNKLFGRVMVHKSCISEGYVHKVWRARVIYGLEPVFESGHTCIIKAQRHSAYGGKEEHCLTDKNLDFVKENCKVQNLAREYCKIFSAETRVIENFGPPLEVIPVYLMYRPANTIPYATVEADLIGVYQKYLEMDHMGRIEMRMASEVQLKCCALQHWVFQWTNGNLLITQLEGVDTKITNIGITVKSTGHQGLQMEGKPEVLEAFVSQHQCNYFCGLLGLRSLKLLDSLTATPKTKGSRSPLIQRKSQVPESCSPQTSRRAANSPRAPRKAEQDAPKNLKEAVEVSF